MSEAFRSSDRLVAIEVIEGAEAPSPELDQERRVAIFDLLEENRFRMAGDDAGPYRLTLGLEGRKLKCVLQNEVGGELRTFFTPLGGVRTIVEDYLAVCDDYFDAIKRLSPGQIEVIDGSRRDLHNEGSDALSAKLAAEAEVDPPTARRLFTLLCAIYPRS